jgi:hypothetical protein
MNLSFLLPKVRRDFAAAEARAARGDWPSEVGFAPHGPRRSEIGGRAA